MNLPTPPGMCPHPDLCGDAAPGGRERRYPAPRLPAPLPQPSTAPAQTAPRAPPSPRPGQGDGGQWVPVPPHHPPCRTSARARAASSSCGRGAARRRTGSAPTCGGTQSGRACAPSPAPTQGLRPPAPPSPGPHSRAAAAAPGGDTGPSAGAGSVPARSTSRTYAARGRGLSAGWVLGRGPQPTPPSGISTGPSPRPCTTGTEPEGGLCPPPGPGPSLGTQQPPGAHLQHSLALVLAGAAGGREGGIWGPLQGRGAAAPTPFPGTAWDKSAGAPAPSPGGGGCPVPHVPPLPRHARVELGLQRGRRAAGLAAELQPSIPLQLPELPLIDFAVGSQQAAAQRALPSIY